VKITVDFDDELSPSHIALIMEAVRTSEKMVFHNETKRRLIPEGYNLQILIQSVFCVAKLSVMAILQNSELMLAQTLNLCVDI
jgi:hypothetical protein